MELFVQHRVVAPISIVACIALAGCGGGGGSSRTPQNTPPPIIHFSHAYASHPVTATNGTPWMITNIATTLSGEMYIGGADLYDTLRVDVTVSPTLSSNDLALPGQGGGFGIAIGIDPSGNGKPGGLADCAGGNSGPFEFFSGNGPRLIDGNYPIYDVGGVIYSGSSNPPEEAVTSVASGVISQSFYLPSVRVFSGRSVPHVGLAVSAFDGVDTFDTDCEPANGSEQFTDR